MRVFLGTLLLPLGCVAAGASRVVTGVKPAPTRSHPCALPNDKINAPKSASRLENAEIEVTAEEACAQTERGVPRLKEVMKPTSPTVGAREAAFAQAEGFVPRPERFLKIFLVRIGARV